ncbi:uncharacterized protein C2orf81 homolog [Nerophis ophidion]|uniref:uncharacterized protein C2orf81 homolog n=1 Tax=Nerophis ophidion TaxID=159077 RepID=UPI002ADFFF69|nr:uncharacterized protein C2orf81 homolog [Nerophis ophidion]XP_061762248.1 uncharacterized protein C2orf81 homolog [Nerophis ophidion]XP_061762249.1 uncharacterized protein C2orf81 homolog [Nerophis ophidion]XP_061762250.1 uncharacterized protein C2orf81 homolog [Nerophis ophidion]
MSRSAAKAQADKSKAPARVSPPQPHEPEEEDIIPGCLTRSQWMDMLSREEAEDLVGEIMAELMTRVMEGCYNVHIKRQVASFTAFWAKVYFIQTLEHHLMCRDKWEDAMELTRTEDSEPRPITPDVWSEGCFPVIHGTPQAEPTPPKIIQKSGTCKSLRPPEPRTSQKNNPVSQTSVSSKTSVAKISLSKSVGGEKISNEPSPRPKQDTYPKKKQKACLPPKLDPETVLPPVSCLAGKLETKGDNKVPSVSKHTAGSSQQQHKTRSVRKPEHNPMANYWITPQYEIVNKRRKTVKKSDLPEQQQSDIMETSWNSARSAEPAKPASRTGVQRGKLSPIKDDIITRALRLDTMHLAKGVSLIDHQRTTAGPVAFTSQAQSAKLRPIQTDAVKSQFSVDQLTAGPPPQVIQCLKRPEKFDL